ncbi:MAG TPA: sigma-70 family RNA polymerase sigma factor [Solirubrobacterales bacterium]|nr:sigma-70 family RNA polymerase sigma factor [Solirubrobacterales bacterium]
MGTEAAGPTAAEQELLAAAQNGDEAAFARLVDQHRGELHAHCYRMLGSVHDAEDALQEAQLRAWRGLSKFAGRSSLRSWLYRIATNACLDAIGKRPKRVLPVDYAPSDPHDGPGEPMVESTWIGPYPDEAMGIEDGYAAPEARYEQREAIELAFVAALQHLPANQRAALILREVLGFSAKEAAETLDTSTASINSALQRARATVEERLPEQSQQATLRELGEEGVRETVEAYVDAWLREDVEAVVAMLTEDAAFTMPPLRSWFRGREQIAIFLADSPMSGEWRWKTLRTRANGQEAIAFYTWSDELGAYERFALNVLTLRGREIAEVDAFLTRASDELPREEIVRLPEQPFDPGRLAAAFERFGLPETLRD